MNGQVEATGVGSAGVFDEGDADGTWPLLPEQHNIHFSAMNEETE